ncbi:helix-turn-helix domain-containing protein [Olsenella profusa]|uniref:Helix-turn-helix domain-containing protein n=1 Tax=Olsenella profusa TaxID=138595 RepID=A0ABS2F2Q7_9ACTN|nr:helix-turn-helix transcriptional regulator [Olsenella profusa]MBM6775269.1 helix-turn-helix domain-containing protein [Olsenella profusa]
MARPRFSEALVARRHELGLSVSQASRILKLREDVLIAFEEGDYDHMPQSGYAQGMLSSYARYLGLNAREIVDLFQEEIYQYRHGTSSHELRRRTRQTQSGRGVSGYDLVNEAGSRPKAYVEYRPLLPTSGGPAGDMGDFATTAPARPRTSVPLAGVGSAAPGTRGAYGSYASSAPYGHVARERVDGHPYNTGAPSDHAPASTARRRAANRRRRPNDQASRLLNEGQQHSYPEERDGGRSRARTGRLYRRDDVSTRRVGSGEYTDDLRYDDHASPYAPASTLSGRRSSRNIARVERPNVQRRAARSRSGAPVGRGRQRSGVAGVLDAFLSDPRRALLALILLLAAVLTAILVFSVSSCVNRGGQEAQPGHVVQVNTTGTSDDAGGEADPDAQGAGSDAETGDEPGTGAADAEAGSDADADADAQGVAEPEETVVEVSVASGEVSWVEVTCDGVSEVADSLTGPWSASYTVHDSITVQVTNPAAVTVTENGERRDFSSHAGGRAALTIEGTPLPEDATDPESGAEAAAGGAGAGA